MGAGWGVVLTLLAVLSAPVPVARAGAVVDAVVERGRLVCGVSGEHPGFSSTDVTGEWRGFDVDICRAVALAVLGSAEDVRFVPLNAQVRLDALVTGEIDVLSRTTTWTLSRDIDVPIEFPAVTLYDGQGFLAYKAGDRTRLSQFEGATVCVSKGTTTLANLKEWIRVHAVSLHLSEWESYTGQYEAFFNRRCDLFTNDRTGLASLRAAFAKSRDDYALLEDVISKEPLSVAVREGDPEWADVVRWTVHALVTAEELGVGAANIDARRAEVAADPKGHSRALRILAGLEPGSGAGMGLDDGWAYRVVSQLGNYGEVFARNLGEDTGLGLDRGLNRLWSDGGLMYAPPMR